MAASSGERPVTNCRYCRADEEEAERSQELDGDGERPGAEAASPEQARVEQRLVHAQLPEHEADAADDAESERARA